MTAFYIGKQWTTVHLDSGATRGTCALLEMHHPQNFGPPVHSHAREDEAFFIIAGSYLFEVDGQRLMLHPGDSIVAPRGVTHSFTCTSAEEGRMLVVLHPAGGEAYFQKMGLIDANDPYRREKCQALDHEYGITIEGAPITNAAAPIPSL